MPIEKVKAMKAAALLGIGAFLGLYAASFVIASLSGIALGDYASVLISRDAFLLEDFAVRLQGADAVGAFRLILVLELFIGLSFGAGFFALFSLWSMKAREGALAEVSHRVVAYLSGLTGLLDLIGTAFILSAFSGARPVPAFQATIGGMAYISRLPLTFIIILWCAGGALSALFLRLRGAMEKRRASNPAQKTVP